ncbi:MAG: S4 domain-containing protein [Polyangiaceae bacterium]
MTSGVARARFKVGRAEAGLRLDQALSARVEGLSRRKARALIDLGGVFVDGARVKVAGRTVREGQEILAVMGGVRTGDEGGGERGAAAGRGGAAGVRDRAVR